MKTHSSFFNEKTISLIRENLKTNQAASKMAAGFIAESKPWFEMSYEELKSAVFSPTLKRSWFVRSDGNCPSCSQSVPMYTWLHDPFKYPWKMQCPHCKEFFPKNDFGLYYKSGLDDNGVFHHEKADKTLLINGNGTSFGVDDGNGWFDSKGLRYLFIGAYLSHAQWSHLVTKGVFYLGFSYVLTGDKEYARKAAVLLFSIARFWPDYDFYTQGVMYEKENMSQGYVNYWVNSNNEVRNYAMVYDQIFDSIINDREFEFVSGISALDFANTVETRIFLDSLKNIIKISSNPPETPITVAIIKTVLNFDKDEVEDLIDKTIADATQIDGMSGESGLGGYAAITPRAIADLLCLFYNSDYEYISKKLKKHPQLYKTFRFHIDTWYDAKYYPGVGDSSVFAHRVEQYAALFTDYRPLISMCFHSREWFAMALYNHFDDPDFAKSIYLSNKNNLNSCFTNDYFVEDPTFYDNKLKSVLNNYGSDIIQKSIDYNEWRISLLHSGSGENKTLVAMPYSSGANHCHHDALSLHIFSKGVNISPDYGYPPVNYGGWFTKQAYWYGHPAAHNQVVIDGKRHTNLPKGGDGIFYRYPEHGQNILFTAGSFVKAAYNRAPEYNNIKRNERMIAIVEISASDNYIIDISRTDGGLNHSRFLHGSYSTLTSNGINPSESEEYFPEETILRNSKTDYNPKLNWSIDWKLYSDEHLTPLSRNLHLKYTSLTAGSSVSICESWVDVTRMGQIAGIQTGSKSIWIPTIYETLTGPKSQFNGILEVYEDCTKINDITHPLSELPGCFDSAIKIVHSNETVDYIIANDPETKKAIVIHEYNIESDAVLAVIRFKNGIFKKADICNGSYLKIGNKLYSAQTPCKTVNFF